MPASSVSDAESARVACRRRVARTGYRARPVPGWCPAPLFSGALGRPPPKARLLLQSSRPRRQQFFDLASGGRYHPPVWQGRRRGESGWGSGPSPSGALALPAGGSAAAGSSGDRPASPSAGAIGAATPVRRRLTPPFERRLLVAVGLLRRVSGCGFFDHVPRHTPPRSAIYVERRTLKANRRSNRLQSLAKRWRLTSARHCSPAGAACFHYTVLNTALTRPSRGWRPGSSTRPSASRCRSGSPPARRTSQTRPRRLSSRAFW